MNILILCTGNSCRSQIAHGFLDQLTDNSISVFSAGVEKHGLNKNADDFGNFTNGVWTPKEYTGGHGTYGAYLKFENASDLGNDSSGNDNDWTANNMGTDPVSYTHLTLPTKA